jgi:RHS repeat-associated protein
LKTEHKGGSKRSLLRGRRIGVYPGQYYDQETGLHYNYFRSYHPGIGRYLTPDPIGLAGGINPFVYVANNPVNNYDFMGLFISYIKDCPKCWEYQDQIAKAEQECKDEYARCQDKGVEEEVKFGDQYGVYYGSAIYNCVKAKTGNPNIWQDMKESCGKCGFLKGAIKIWRKLPW